MTDSQDRTQILKKLDEQTAVLRRLTEPKAKDGWDKFSAISAFLGAGVLALAGSFATILYNSRESERNQLNKKREVLISETQAVKDLIPQLTGSNREARRTALLTLCSLNNVDLATRLAPQYALDGGIEALEDLNRRIADEPDKIKVVEALAIAYKRRGDSYSADKYYFDALKDYSRSISLNRSYADTYRERFYAYAFTKKFHEAQADINSYVGLTGDEVMNKYLHGRMEMEKGDYVKAIQFFNEAIKLEFWWPELFYRKAVASHHRGEHKIAVDHYSKAITDNSHRPDPAYYDDRAYCKEELGDSRGAKEDRRKAEEIRKSNQAQAQQSAGT